MGLIDILYKRECGTWYWVDSGDIYQNNQWLITFPLISRSPRQLYTVGYTDYTTQCQTVRQSDYTHFLSSVLSTNTTQSQCPPAPSTTLGWPTLLPVETLVKMFSRPAYSFFRSNNLTSFTKTFFFKMNWKCQCISFYLLHSGRQGMRQRWLVVALVQLKYSPFIWTF